MPSSPSRSNNPWSILEARLFHLADLSEKQEEEDEEKDFPFFRLIHFPVVPQSTKSSNLFLFCFSHI